MKLVTLIDGYSEKKISLEKLIGKVNNGETSLPFSDDIIEFCGILSLDILKMGKIYKRPDLVSLGFWLRKSQILKLKKDEHALFKKAKGLVFHIPPANVETIFFYSLMISLLCGNKNIVKISSRDSEVAHLLIRAFYEVIDKNKNFEFLKVSTQFVKYDRDDTVNQVLSACCDLRVVWGGDQTVSNLRKFPVSPRSLDVGFSDRFSFSVFKSTFLLGMSDELLSKTVKDFYNDAYLFDQKACSSPKVIIWTGNKDNSSRAQARFFDALASFVDSSYLKCQESSFSINRYKELYRLSSFTFLKDFSLKGKGVLVSSLVDFEGLITLRSLDFGGGVFVNLALSTIQEIETYLSVKDQTLTYLGYTKEEMANFVISMRGKGIDRVVPLGSALNFSYKWDGYNLINIFSREIYVE